jgi:hypothetical protein
VCWDKLGDPVRAQAAYRRAGAAAAALPDAGLPDAAWMDTGEPGPHRT